MKQEILTQFPDLWMPLTALGLFLSLFVGFAVYVYFLEPKSKIDLKANLPLGGDE
jgi:hypothetical protein